MTKCHQWRWANSVSSWPSTKSTGKNEAVSPGDQQSRVQSCGGRDELGQRTPGKISNHECCPSQATVSLASAESEEMVEMPPATNQSLVFSGQVICRWRNTKDQQWIHDDRNELVQRSRGGRKEREPALINPWTRSLRWCRHQQKAAKIFLVERKKKKR